MNESSKAILKIPFQVHRIKVHHRWMSTVSNVELEDKLIDIPQYPPIENVIVNYRDKLRERKNDWFTKIERLPTVEQKLIELNMPKYYGYFSVLLTDHTLSTNCLDFLKFCTRTQVYNNLPTQYYKDEKKTLEEAVSAVKGPVEELISLHFGHRVFREFVNKYPEIIYEKLSNQNFLIDLNNVLMKCLSTYIPHLPCTSVDLQPRIEAFWFVGGFEPAQVRRKKLAGRPNTKMCADDPVDRNFRSSSRPVVAVRTNHGLPDVIPFDVNLEEIQKSIQDVTQTSEQSLESNVAEQSNDYSAESFTPLPWSPYYTDPKAWGLLSRRRKGVIVPGFWPGVKDEYGHIFFHSREMSNKRVRLFGESFASAFRQQHAIVNGFTQALSYGLYQGFTPASEMTYPVVQQSVSSDGQMFQFALYQLNTCRLHSHYSTDNERMNYLWLSDDMPLFESVEGDNVKGLNEDVLRRLCSMYLKKGQPRENPSPYLADYKYLMHHDAPEEYKEEFRQQLLRIMADSPKSKNVHLPEILPWEYIYKVKFKTRPQDRKSKFFENRWAMNPYTRRLDDYLLPYIPKVRRLDFKIKSQPRLNSEHLFKHDWKTLKKKAQLYDDDEIAFKSMNIDKDTPPYFNGLLWRRGMNKHKPKI